MVFIGGKPMQRVLEYLGVAFAEEHLRQLWEMGEAILLELERRTKKEKLNKSAQRLLFETVSTEYEREVSGGRTADIRKMANEETSSTAALTFGAQSSIKWDLRISCHLRQGPGCD